MQDNTKLFSGLAENYQGFRPSYPEELSPELSRFILRGQRIHWPDQPIALDVGAGTGISTRYLAKALGSEFQYIGLEPNEDMRKAAQSTPFSEQSITYQNGTAEELPFADKSCGVVFVGQAIHWFDRDKFYKEARRVLLPGGVLSIIYNNRNWHTSKFLAEFESFQENLISDYTRFYRSTDTWDKWKYRSVSGGIQQELDDLFGFAGGKTLVHQWSRQMTMDEFIGMFLSYSRTKKIIENYDINKVIVQAKELIAKYLDKNNQVEVSYTTELLMTRRIEPI